MNILKKIVDDNYNFMLLLMITIIAIIITILIYIIFEYIGNKHSQYRIQYYKNIIEERKEIN